MTTLTSVIHATSKADLEQQLDRAVALALTKATEQRQGILVTRHSHIRFSVAVSSEVPYGETHERDAA
ncbi:hypothetical protein [Pseudarthrobacter sp. H2]|uniref:hypothetical protein n=1 Tax=Pseudarthrobacter sp. H2 TaxID=3418415 RepID=UPI003CF38BB3